MVYSWLCSLDWCVLWESRGHKWRNRLEVFCISSPRDSTCGEDQVCKLKTALTIKLHGYTNNSVFSVFWKCHFFFLFGFFFLKTKGDEDIGIRVRVRVQKSKVCCVPLPEKAVCSLIFLKSLFNISDSILK